LDVQKRKIENGKFDKTKGLTFLSEAEFLGKTLPAPNKYVDKKALVLKRNPSWKFSKPKKREHWKPKKTKGPDVGSYEHHKSIKHSSSMKNITATLPFAAAKEGPNKSKDKFAYQNSKKWVPGVGQYK